MRQWVPIAKDSPHGPAWISASIDEADASGVIAVIVTRRVRSGLLLPALGLVDRTCLGVKDAHALMPQPETELAFAVEQLGERMGRFRPCDALFAQSVVFHAVDYAESLGFSPHRDFDPELFGPRPLELIDTPHARPPVPIFIAGPHDDVRRVRATLDASVGAGNYLVLDPFGPGPGADPERAADYAHDPVDWNQATTGRETLELLAGLDLESAGGIEEAVAVFEQALASGYYRDWEAVIRDEQFLEIPPEHAAVFDADEELEFDGYEIRTIRGEPCPSAIWYETARRVAKSLALGCARGTLTPAVSAALAAQLEHAIAQHAGHLLLPDDCDEPLEVLPYGFAELTRGAREVPASAPRATGRVQSRDVG